MPDAAEVAVEAALLAYAQDFATAKSLPIAMPGIAFTPPTASKTAKWLRATFLPSETEAMSLEFDGTAKIYGYLQLDVFVAMGAGELGAARTAAEAKAHFRRGTTLVRDGFTVRILKEPHRGSFIEGRTTESMGTSQGGAWSFVPLRIPYCCLT
jgi:hypothetical protein